MYTRDACRCRTDCIELPSPSGTEGRNESHRLPAPHSQLPTAAAFFWNALRRFRPVQEWHAHEIHGRQVLGGKGRQRP